MIRICGVRIEEIEDPKMLDMRVLDKLVDELAKENRWRKFKTFNGQISIEIIVNGKIRQKNNG